MGGIRRVVAAHRTEDTTVELDDRDPELGEDGPVVAAERHPPVCEADHGEVVLVEGLGEDCHELTLCSRPLVAERVHIHLSQSFTILTTTAG
ncbi:hypothetical protein ACLTEW_03545 [Gordonia lacunae]|uniref:hypothetical protein n=1 Tax=Gordonia lacunae TaxID=417102 RepID=UPI0039E4E8C9